MGVDIWPWVFGLASSEEDIRDELIDLTNKLEERVVREVLQSELALSGVTRVL